MDAKGRVSLPAKFRKTVEASGVTGDEIHMILSKDKTHIVAYLASDIAKKLADVKSNEGLDVPDGVDDIRTAFFSGASMSPCDGAGRIGLSKNHIKRSGILKECIFDGMGDYFVIYLEERFVEMKRQKDADFEIEDVLS